MAAVPSAVVRKYSDDRAGQLAARISHAAFLTVFPMVLVLLTLVGVFLQGHKSLQDEIINSALRQFPVLGSDLRSNVHTLSTSNVVVLAVATLGLLYGAMKLSRASQVMVAAVLGHPPGRPARLLALDPACRRLPGRARGGILRR